MLLICSKDYQDFYHIFCNVQGNIGLTSITVTITVTLHFTPPFSTTLVNGSLLLYSNVHNLIPCQSIEIESPLVNRLQYVKFHNLNRSYKLK